MSMASGLRLREQDLANKVAIVTGASRGIGRAIALNLASRGCSILGTCSATSSLPHIDTLSHAVSEFYKENQHASSTPQVVGLAANVFSTATPRTISDNINSHFDGKVDIFINSACKADAQKVGEITDDAVQDYFDGNMRFPVMMIEELVKRKQFRRDSRIIFISSIRTRKAWSMQVMYMATKAAGEAMCRAYADAFGGKNPEFEFMAGTTVNAVAVGLTRTDAVYTLPEDIVKTIEDEFVPQQALPRVGEPGEVADVVGLLCREESKWITGSVVSADGGSMRIY